MFKILHCQQRDVVALLLLLKLNIININPRNHNNSAIFLLIFIKNSSHLPFIGGIISSFKGLLNENQIFEILISFHFLVDNYLENLDELKLITVSLVVHIVGFFRQIWAQNQYQIVGFFLPNTGPDFTKERLRV